MTFKDPSTCETREELIEYVNYMIEIHEIVRTERENWKEAYENQSTRIARILCKMNDIIQEER